MLPTSPCIEYLTNFAIKLSEAYIPISVKLGNQTRLTKPTECFTHSLPCSTASLAFFLPSFPPSSPPSFSLPPFSYYPHLLPPLSCSQAVLLVLWSLWNVLKGTFCSWVIAKLVGPATVGGTKAAAGAKAAAAAACRPVVDRTDIVASLAIMTSVTRVIRPRGKVLALGLIVAMIWNLGCVWLLNWIDSQRPFEFMWLNWLILGETVCLLVCLFVSAGISNHAHDGLNEDVRR